MGRHAGVGNRPATPWGRHHAAPDTHRAIQRRARRRDAQRQRQALIRLALLALALPLVAAPAHPAPQQATGDVLLTDASAEDVAKAVAGSGHAVRPGKWELRVELLDMDLGEPGARATVADAVKSTEPQVTTQCITAADAKRGAIEAFFPSSGAECRYSRYALTGGRLDAASVCDSVIGKMAARLTGTLSSGQFTVENSSVMEMTSTAPEMVDGKPVASRDGNAPVTRTSVRARLSGRWIGACKSG